MRAALSTPICPHIYFAGEHTVHDYHGNVHAAYESGIGAANQVIGTLPCKTRANISKASHVTYARTVVILTLLLIYIFRY